jgi:hypothetical protein
MISIEGTVVALGNLIGKDKIGHIRLLLTRPPWWVGWSCPKY